MNDRHNPRTTVHAHASRHRRARATRGTEHETRSNARCRKMWHASAISRALNVEARMNHTSMSIYIWKRGMSSRELPGLCATTSVPGAPPAYCTPRPPAARPPASLPSPSQLVPSRYLEDSQLHGCAMIPTTSHDPRPDYRCCYATSMSPSRPVQPRSRLGATPASGHSATELHMERTRA